MQTSEAARKIELLEEYISSLERENQAKSHESVTLYSQIDKLHELIAQLQSKVKEQDGRNPRQESIVIQTQPDSRQKEIDNFRTQSGLQLDHIKQLEITIQELMDIQDAHNQLKDTVHALTERCVTAEAKAQQITVLQKDNQLLKHKCEVLKQVSDRNERLLVQARSSIFELTSQTGTSPAGYSSRQISLIEDNNRLVERVREVEQQKIQYFNRFNGIRCSARKENRGLASSYNALLDKTEQVKQKNQQLKAKLRMGSS